MTCSFCEKDCCLGSLTYYLTNLSSPDITQFVVTYYNKGHTIFTLSSYNKETLIAEIDFDGHTTRFFNAVPYSKFSSLKICPLFNKLETYCESDEFVKTHNISFKQYGEET